MLYSYKVKRAFSSRKWVKSPINKIFLFSRFWLIEMLRRPLPSYLYIIMKGNLLSIDKQTKINILIH